MKTVTGFTHDIFVWRRLGCLTRPYDIMHLTKITCRTSSNVVEFTERKRALSSSTVLTADCTVAAMLPTATPLGVNPTAQRLTAPNKLNGSILVYFTCLSLKTLYSYQAQSASRAIQSQTLAL